MSVESDDDKYERFESVEWSEGVIERKGDTARYPIRQAQRVYRLICFWGSEADFRRNRRG